jgi:hypothetical protein
MALAELEPAALVQGGSFASPGLMALGELTDEQFERQLRLIATSVHRVELLKTELLEKGVDYGIVPGTKKPTLYLAGAQKLCFMMRLVPTFTWERMVGDNDTLPALGYVVTCSLRLGSEKGPLVAQGIGAANSWETKYRYVTGERLCPNCSKPTIRRSKWRPKGSPEGTEPGWYCHAGQGGCGKNFDYEDSQIRGQLVGKVSNPDPHSNENTLIKMAKKRSFVDGTLTATASSGTFTQDLEESAEDSSVRERDRLKREFGAILRDQGKITTLKPMLAVMSELLKRDVADYRIVEKLPLVELRMLVDAARVKYNVEIPQEELQQTTATVEIDDTEDDGKGETIEPTDQG